MKNAELLTLARAACDTLMRTYTPEDLPPAGHFHYHQGVFLEGMFRFWKITHEAKYFDYIKGYYDSLIDEQGNLYFDRDQLDSLQVGNLLFPLYEETKDRRYLIAAKKLRYIIDGINKTSEGGFWHKDKYPYQMWLDGLYMAGPFLLKCSDYFQESRLVDQVLYQEQLMRNHMLDTSSGLLYHAWDEKCAQPWANPITGCSPEFWGRSAGWYGVALVDILEQMPDNHAGRKNLEDNLRNYITSILKVQDAETKGWYQVLDKGDREDNWLESSCAALFIYTIAKAVTSDIFDGEELITDMLEGFIETHVELKDDDFFLKNICIGTSAGEYAYYVDRPTAVNDLHGVGAFLWAILSAYEVLEKNTESVSVLETVK